MPSKKPTPAKPPRKSAKASLAAEVAAVLAALKRKSTPKDRANLARFGIVTDRYFGVSMSNMRTIANGIGRNHELAAALWDTGWYEARMLATLIDDPDLVTPAQMERWCRDFDNWAICDTACFCLFDRTPHAWKKIAQWSDRRAEFERRAAFALLASVSLHDKKSDDAPFLATLAHRARRERRAELRQKGRELGPARLGPAQPRAPRGGGRAGPAPGVFRSADGTVGGEGRTRGSEPASRGQAARVAAAQGETLGEPLGETSARERHQPR